MTGCTEDRPRPGPPALGVVFDRTVDTLSGIVWAQDPDGIDSLWLSLDAARVAKDGYFKSTFSSRFTYDVPRPLGGGATTVQVRLSARDALGFASFLDTTARVSP